MIHTIKGFGIVNKAEIDVFLVIQLQALLEAWSLGDFAVVGGVEGATEAPEHAGYCQLILRVAIEGSRVGGRGEKLGLWTVKLDIES